ncbi:reverse transcriptase domain-containing protein [Tanacetum coccineum]
MSLLFGNSSSRSPKNFHTIIESLPLSINLIEDSDSNREEIDIFSGPDDSIPLGIESDFDSEEDIIDNLLNDDPIPEYERLTFDMEPDVPVINNVNEDECFDPRGGEINVEVNDSFTFVTRTFLLYLTYPEPGHLAARLGCAETKVATWDDLAFNSLFSVKRLKQSTDITNNTRKRPKLDKQGHENGKECTRAGDLTCLKRFKQKATKSSSTSSLKALSSLGIGWLLDDKTCLSPPWIPHHGFTELTQVDTFYNGLNENEQDSLNAAAGGNLLSKTTREALNIIENKSKVRYSRNRSNASRMNATSSKTDERIDKLADQLSTLVEIVSKKVVTPAPVKAVEETCVTCGGAHSWYNCPATDNNQASVCATTGTYNQVNPPNRVSNQMAPPGFAPVQNNGQNSGVAYEEPSIPTNPSPKKNLPKPNIPYLSRHDDQKSRDKASNQMDKIFQIFQDLRFNISFADALLLMPRFAPTIKSLLMNKEKLLELAKIPLNENCSAMLLKKLPKKLGDPDKFLIPCNFLGMDICHALVDLGASINLMPLSIWKMLSLPELTPTRMTLELEDRSITLPKGVTEDIFVKVRNFHFPTDFVVVDFEVDPRVPLILGRSFLRTNHSLIDVYEGELVLRDRNEQITFHVDGMSKHPQKHINESIKMVNDSCKDSFKRFTNEPALVFSPSPKDVDDEKEKQEVKNLAEPTAKRQTLSLVFAITSTLPSIEPKDSLIMGDEHLSTFSVEEIVPVLRESEDTSRSDSENVLPSCDDLSSINVPLLEDIECKDSYDSNLDESTFLVTPLFNSNKDECLAPGDDIEFLLHHDPSTPLKSVASILKGFINEPPFEENDDLFDLECDNDEIDAFLAIKVPTYIEKCYYDSEGDVLYLESLLSDDTTHNLSSEVFFDHEPQHDTFSPKSDPLHHKFAGSVITIPPRIVREQKDYINRMSLLCGNSFSRSPKNSHTIIKSLPTSTTLIEDIDSNREEIDIFSGPDDSIPPGIESDFDSEEDIIDNLLNDDPILEYERLTFNMEPDVHVINNGDELNEDECFDPGGGEINVEVDDSFTFEIQIFLPYLTYPEVSPLLSSTKNEDTIFNPGIFAFHFSFQEPVVVKRFMEFCSSTCFIPKDE